ncbi:InlB B-repeat-containing protein, partial [Butyrivibrio sp. VCB2006]|uniref:InlB B-repeat-containing protein n=1 Tax=Butyrivibrio sp. VCB2006 TaxID=1280679 RepID=UPI0004A27A71
MLKKWNRSLAILLAFALVVTTFGSDWASTRAFAVGSEEELTLLEDIGDNTVDAQQDNQDGQNQDQQSENQDQQPENQDQQPENQGQQSETPAQENTDPETTADDAAASEAGAAGDDAANTGDTISGDAAAADNTGAATEATTVEAATEATTAEAATEATTAEEAATAATSAEVKEKLVTVTYKSTKGGRVSKSKETVDINKKDAKFEGAKAEAWNDEYTFVDWTDADGNQVCTEATFVPSGLEADAVFTANFIAEEDIADKMPGIEANNVHKGGMVVSVKAEIGVFPKGTEVEINPVSDAQALETAQQVMENATQAKGVDITFYYTNEDGVRSEIQPADGKYVHVELALDDAIEGEEFSVIHEHDGVVEEINATISTQDANSDPADDTKEATAVSFNSTQFSVFVVANNGSTEDQSQDLHATLTYNFYTKEGDAEPYNTQIVVEGETLHDPGYPPLEQDEEFLGWYYQKDGQKTKVEFTTVGNVTSGEVINCYADIKTTYYVTFIGYKGEVVQVKKLTVTTGQSTKINLEKETYTPDEAEEVFKGWTTDKVKPNPDTRTVVKEIDASKDHYVYAVVVKGYWIRFDENDGGSGGGASYTGPKAVFEGQAAIGSKPNDPTRPGYDFGGWYEKAGANPGEVVESSAFNWDGTLSKDITLYAKWTPKTKTKYTVIIWQQQAEEESKYDYKASYSLEGKTDTVITDDMLSDYIDHPDKGFKYNASKKTIVYGEDNKSTTIIRAKGDTVVNLYFDRETYTLTFRKKQGGWITSYSEVTTITARYGVNIYGNFPIKVGNTTYRNGWEVDSDSQTYKEGTYLDYIVNMPPENITFTYYNEDPDGYATFIYYVEALEGDTIATNHNGIGFKVLRSVPLPWQRGMKSTEAEEFMDIKGYSKLDSSPAYWNGTANVSVGGTMKLYYKRNRHSIDFYDNFNGITTKVTDVNSKFASVPFEQNLSTYKDIAPKLDDIEGYTFAGWFQDKSGKVPFNWSSTMPDSQLVLYAYYTPVQYHVHLNPDDGTLPEGQKADFDVDYKTILSKTSLEKTTKAGYELVGWFDDKTNFAYGYGEIAEDVNLTARWRSPGTVGITYDGNGHGSGAPEDEYEYYKNSAVVVAGPPTTIEKGFTFLGWKVNNSGTMLYPNNSFVIDPSIIVGGKVTLYAQYEEYGKEGSSETTTITYHANNETDATYTIPVGEEELKKNQGVIALSAADAGFSYTGYKFIGWAKTQEDAAAGTVFVNAGQKIAANNLNTTLVDGVRVGNDLYAVWEREKGTYTVNYYKDSTEGTLLDTKTYTVDLPYTVVIESGTAQGQIDWKKPLGYKSGVVDNNNYDVQADIKDESGAITNPQVINIVYTKLKITITIEAKDDSRPYTGEDQTLTGVKSVSIKDEDGNDVEGLTKDNIILANGGGSVDSVSVTGKNVGPYPMGLTNESFTLNTDAFTVDKWVVTDGTLTITKLPVTVTITGTQQTDKYDGKDHTAEGWDI